MNSGKHGAGNVSNKEDKEMTIGIECTSENEITESSEGRLIIDASDSDNDYSNAESSEGRLIIDISDSDNDYSNAESSAEESVSAERIVDVIPRRNDLDLTSTEERKSHMLSLEDKREDFRKFENGESVADLATPSNITVTTISDIQDKENSNLSRASNRDSKSIISNSRSSDFNIEDSNFSKMSRRKRNVLTFDTKLEILQRIKNGESEVLLSREFNVTRRAITSIKEKEENLLMEASKCKNQDELSKRKVLRKSKSVFIEDTVYMWYLEELYHDKMVTGPLLREKALEVDKLRAPSNFKASESWLYRFKSRYGMENIQRKSEISNRDTSSTNSFQLYLHQLKLGGLSLDDVYNAVETTIQWPSMAQSSIISNRLNEKSIQRPERVTVLFCSNATWSHSLPLLVIGKEECYQTAPSCRLIYKSQNNSSMDSKMFRDWYTNDFIPEVKKKHVPAGKCGEVLLLLHNVRFDLDVDTMNEIDENFEVKNLESNKTPIDQIRKLKRIFKTNILQCLLSSTENEEVKENSQKFLLGKFYILGDVWNILSKEKRKEASNQQMGVPEEQNAAVFNPEIDIEEFLELFRRIPGCAHSSKENALEWLLIDTIISSDQVLNVSETVVSSKPEELLENYDTDDVDTDDKKAYKC